MGVGCGDAEVGDEVLVGDIEEGGGTGEDVGGEGGDGLGGADGGEEGGEESGVLEALFGGELEERGEGGVGGDVF